MKTDMIHDIYEIYDIHEIYDIYEIHDIYDIYDSVSLLLVSFCRSVPPESLQSFFYEGGLPLGAVAVQCFEEFEDGVKGASWCGNEEETINRKVLTRFSLDSHFFLQKYAKAGFVRATSMHRLQCSLRLTISAPDHLQSLITKPMQTSNHQTLPEGFF